MRYIQIHNIRNISTGKIERCLCSFSSSEEDYPNFVASLQEYISDKGWEILHEEGGE